MDVSLGPWTGAMSVGDKLRQPLADAMGDEAWKTVKNTAGFTPQKSPEGKPAPSGFTISGKVTNVVKEGARLHVMATYTLWADGTFANIQPVPGDAYAEGSMTAEDALRAVTEARVTKLLGLIKSGAAAKAH